MSVRIALVLCIGISSQARASVWTFPNDYAGFAKMAGDLSVIDFETLPDGQPTGIGGYLTDTFNYTTQGVYFSAPWGFPEPYSMEDLGFGAGPGTSHDLIASAYAWHHTWIDAQLLTPATAVGVFYPGGTTLSAYGPDGELLGFVQHTGLGYGQFVGIVSTTPIAMARMDSGGSSERIESFHFAAIPEPASLTLLCAGLALIRRRP